MATPMQSLKRITNVFLRHAKVTLMREHELQAINDRYRDIVGQLAGVVAANILPDVEITAERLRRLSDLMGTQVVEGVYLIDRLLYTMPLPGDVCEMGVAQGATSALIASELSCHPEKNIWLYDSFEGLPKPSEKDTLIDDPLNLGNLMNYSGQMAYPVQEVLKRLDTTDFPRERTRIIKGFLDNNIPASNLPIEIAFAYVDFDFYQPILDALNLIHPRLVPDGIIMIDDYGFLSSGAKTATDEFFAQRPDEYVFEVCPPFAGHFATLRKIAPPMVG